MIRDWRDGSAQFNGDQPVDAGAAAQPVVIVEALWDTAVSIDALAGVAFSTLPASGAAPAEIIDAGGIASVAAVGIPSVQGVLPVTDLPGGSSTTPQFDWYPLQPVRVEWDLVDVGGIAGHARVGRPTVSIYPRDQRQRRDEEVLLLAA